MGRRSRIVALRRKRKQRLDGLLRMKAKIDLLELEFCRNAAVFADSRAYEGSGAASAVKWISEYCHMAEEDAADSIVIGRQMANPPGLNSPRP
jgi:hypothetical protein